MSEPDGGKPDDQREARDRAEEATVSIVECLQKVEHVFGLHPDVTGLPADHELVGELRQCVVSYVRAVRLLEITPELALIQVKQIVHDNLHLDEDAGRAIGDDVVKWVVDAYFPAPA